MTWKFLSGLVDDIEVYMDTIGDLDDVAKAKNKLKGQVRQAFWESMLCNLDGVIDLGEDSRVILFMHLLGQVPKKGRESVKALDCAKELENFIDEVVSKDLEKWTETIIASGYLGEGMETKLMKLVEAQETQKLGFKLASEVSLLLKKDNQTKLVRKLMDQLGHDRDAYIHLSRVAPTFTWDNIESAECEALILQLLDGLAHPGNAPVSQEIGKILAVLSALNEASINTLITNKVKGWLEKKNAASGLLYALSTVVYLPLVQFGEETVKKVVDQLLGLLEKGGDVAESAAEALGALPLKEKCDDKIVQEVAGKLIGLLENEDENIAEYATKAVYGIVSNSNFRTIKYFSPSYLTHPKLEALPKVILEKLASPLSTFEEVYSLLAFERILPKDNESWTQVRDEIPTVLDAYWDSLIRPLSEEKKEESTALSSKEGTDERDKKQEKSAIDKEDINKKLGALYEKLVANLKGKEEANLSKEENISRTPLGRRFLSRVYHHILSDRKIDDTELNLMQQLIQSGFTTSIAVIEVKEDGAPQGENEEATLQDKKVSKKEKYSVNFDGKTYLLEDDLSKNNLNKIVDAMLKKQRDPSKQDTQTSLSRQYVDHLPVFPNSGEYLRKASSDVKDEEVISVFDHRMVKKAQYLTLSDVIVTKLVDSLDRSNVYFYKEYRDFLGRHIIEKYTSKKENGKELLSKAISEEYVEGNSEEKVLIKYPHAANPTILHCDRSNPRQVTQETKDKLSEIFGRYEEGETKHARPYTVSFKQVARKITDPEDATGKEYDMDKSEEAEGYMRIVARSFSMNASELSEAHGFLDSVGNTWLFHQSLVGMLNGGKITMNTHIARKSGMFGKAELSEAYSNSGLGEDQRYYAKSFAFALSSHISAYGQDIGLYVRDEADLIPGSIEKLIGAIPMVGSVASPFIGFINQVGKAKASLEEDNKIDQIKHMLSSSFDTHADVSIFSGHAGLKMLSKRKSMISNIDNMPPATLQDICKKIWETSIVQSDDLKEGLLTELRDSVIKRIFGIKDSEVSDRAKRISNLATEDATIFLAYMLSEISGVILDEDLIMELSVKVVGEVAPTSASTEQGHSGTPHEEGRSNDESETTPSSGQSERRKRSRFFRNPFRQLFKRPNSP